MQASSAMQLYTKSQNCKGLVEFILNTGNVTMQARKLYCPLVFSKTFYTLTFQKVRVNPIPQHIFLRGNVKFRVFHATYTYIEIVREHKWTLTKLKPWFRERFLLPIENISVFFIPLTSSAPPLILKREFSSLNEENCI